MKWVIWLIGCVFLVERAIQQEETWQVLALTIALLAGITAVL